MRRDRKSRAKRERMIMIASSALVMGALTLTGIYINGRSDENVDDGYSVDFSQLEDSVDDKFQEIAQNQQDSDILNQEDGSAEDGFGAQAGLWADNRNVQEEIDLPDSSVLEDDLDYDPLAAGSNVIQIPGLTDGSTLSGADGVSDEALEKPGKQGQNAGTDDKASGSGEKAGNAGAKDSGAQNGSGEAKTDNKGKSDNTKGTAKDTATELVVTKDLNFSESQGLVRPVSGEILMHYSMDKSIYFATLDQYKYNPAVMFKATEGDIVTVCADAKVLSVYEHEEIGKAVLLDLGNGYRATYGNLKDLQVTEGAYVNRGEVLGSVAAPTKYFSVEGTNLYFQLTREGTAVNPEGLFE